LTPNSSPAHTTVDEADQLRSVLAILRPDLPLLAPMPSLSTEYFTYSTLPSEYTVPEYILLSLILRRVGWYTCGTGLAGPGCWSLKSTLFPVARLLLPPIPPPLATPPGRPWHPDSTAVCALPWRRPTKNPTLKKMKETACPSPASGRDKTCLTRVGATAGSPRETP